MEISSPNKKPKICVLKWLGIFHTFSFIRHFYWGKTLDAHKFQSPRRSPQHAPLRFTRSKEKKSKIVQEFIIYVYYSLLHIQVFTSCLRTYFAMQRNFYFGLFRRSTFFQLFLNSPLKNWLKNIVIVLQVHD